MEVTISSFEEYTNPDYVNVVFSDGRKATFGKKSIAGGAKAYQTLLQVLDSDREDWKQRLAAALITYLPKKQETEMNEIKKIDLTDQQREQEVRDYFQEYGNPLPANFSLTKFAKTKGYTVYEAGVLLCNLEDESIMSDIAAGNYNTLDVDNERQFNDSYYDMMSELGFSTDEEENEDFDENDKNLQESSPRKFEYLLTYGVYAPEENHTDGINHEDIHRLLKLEVIIKDGLNQLAGLDSYEKLDYKPDYLDLDGDYLVTALQVTAYSNQMHKVEQFMEKLKSKVQPKLGKITFSITSDQDSSLGIDESTSSSVVNTAGELLDYMKANRKHFLQTQNDEDVWGAIYVDDLEKQLQDSDFRVSDTIFVTAEDGEEFETPVSRIDLGESMNENTQMKEQEGRNYMFTEKGQELLKCLSQIPREVALTMWVISKDGLLNPKSRITDTYFNQIEGGVDLKELQGWRLIEPLEIENSIAEQDEENKKLIPQDSLKLAQRVFNNLRSEIPDLHVKHLFTIAQVLAQSGISDTNIIFKENKKMKAKNIEMLTKQIEEATGKKVVLQEAESVSINTVGDSTVEEIIPADSQRVIEEYVDSTLKELKAKIAELETIKFAVSPEARQSGEDWKQKTSGVQFLITQLERVSRFVNNTLQAKKFDKNILDKLVSLTPTVEAPIEAVPIMESKKQKIDFRSIADSIAKQWILKNKGQKVFIDDDDDTELINTLEDIGMSINVFPFARYDMEDILYTSADLVINYVKTHPKEFRRNK